MSDMIEVKTADLIGPALDWAVAKAEGMRQHTPEGLKHVYWYSGDRCIGTHWQPSTSWGQGGPLIEKHRICVTPEYEGQWHADLFRDDEEPLMSVEGATPLIAVCLAVVATEFGLVVSVPKELMP
ncbi:hypothetical protein C4K26_2101 [Pseudomonas chlororaphis]|uniref:phage protein NinX family protein n=1 Tax=Pseudomonas chlororaphis TaxID=587753 RepID=UPI000F55C009|nr:phage protein NinX family protein [Pseudomonas chlororaphis]AZD07504.1 hypothetical protein C4K26_2101 [Pseudomonas chlororaphis]